LGGAGVGAGSQIENIVSASPKRAGSGENRGGAMGAWEAERVSRGSVRRRTDQSWVSDLVLHLILRRLYRNRGGDLVLLPEQFSVVEHMLFFYPLFIPVILLPLRQVNKRDQWPPGSRDCTCTSTSATASSPLPRGALTFAAPHTRQVTQ
jgi:hypothetical protein